MQALPGLPLLHCLLTPLHSTPSLWLHYVGSTMCLPCPPSFLSSLIRSPLHSCSPHLSPSLLPPQIAGPIQFHGQARLRNNAARLSSAPIWCPPKYQRRCCIVMPIVMTPVTTHAHPSGRSSSRTRARSRSLQKRSRSLQKRSRSLQKRTRSPQKQSRSKKCSQSRSPKRGRSKSRERSRSRSARRKRKGSGSRQTGVAQDGTWCRQQHMIHATHEARRAGSARQVSLQGARERPLHLLCSPCGSSAAPPDTTSACEQGP